MAVGVRAIVSTLGDAPAVAFSVLVSFVYGTDTVVLGAVADRKLPHRGRGLGYLLAGRGIGGMLDGGGGARLAGYARSPINSSPWPDTGCRRRCWS